MTVVCVCVCVMMMCEGIKSNSNSWEEGFTLYNNLFKYIYRNSRLCYNVDMIGSAEDEGEKL